MKMRDFFSRFNNEYSQTFQKSRLISQIPLFVIAVLTVCEIGWLIYAISQTENIADEMWMSIKKTFAFLTVIIAAFFGRFLLLFSKAISAFWFSQILWLVSLITLFAFVDLNHRPCWLGILPDLSIIYSLYMFGSPLHQFIVLLFSLNKVFAK